MFITNEIKNMLQHTVSNIVLRGVNAQRSAADPRVWVAECHALLYQRYVFPSFKSIAPASTADITSSANVNRKEQDHAMRFYAKTLTKWRLGQD